MPRRVVTGQLTVMQDRSELLSYQGQHRNCLHSCTTSASQVISTNLPEAKAVSTPLKLARSILSNSALVILPVEISSNGGSPVTM